MTPVASARRDLLAKAVEPLRKALEPNCVPTDAATPPTLAQHAAQRLQFGARAGDAARIAAIGFEAFVDEQLAPAAIDDSAADAILATFPHDAMAESWAQLFDRVRSGWEDAMLPLWQTYDASWVRMINSRRQLFERTVHFWHEHFNVNAFDFFNNALFTKWDAMIRQHAFGNFRAFLEATASHPVMLYYLDNHVNKTGAPNENYARELFELHTLGAMNYRPDQASAITCNATNDADGDGVRDFYIDNDVYEAARCFTGWSIQWEDTEADRGQFLYTHTDHDRFNKLVLCQYIPADTEPLADGRQVLDLLAKHPGTARHICWKLCRRFVADDPPAELVASAAQVFLALSEAPDQIAQVIRHILVSDAFRAAGGTKFKRPMEWMASMFRALEIPYVVVENQFHLAWFLDPMGQPLFGWRPPNGPPDIMGAWSTSNGLLKRWNMASIIASEWWKSLGVYSRVVPPADAKTPTQIVDWWIDRIIGRPVSGATREALLRFVAEGRNRDLPLGTEAIATKSGFIGAVCVTTPEFMRQ